MADVIIGIDPHKGSHTAVAVDATEAVLGELRVRASAKQVDRLRTWARCWPERSLAVEGSHGLGHLLAQQLVADGERVVDVQPKLAARVRLLNTGKVKKNDPTTPTQSRSRRCAHPRCGRSHQMIRRVCEVVGASTPRIEPSAQPTGLPTARRALRSDPGWLRQGNHRRTGGHRRGQD